MKSVPVRAVVVSDGLTALERLLHEPYDLLISRRELKELNGFALIVAAKMSERRNRNIPVIFVTSDPSMIPDHAFIDAVLPRDDKLAANLPALVRRILAV